MQVLNFLILQFPKICDFFFFFAFAFALVVIFVMEKSQTTGKQ